MSVINKSAVEAEAMNLSGLLLRKAEIEKEYMPAVSDEDVMKLWAYLCPDEYIDILQMLGKKVANIVESYPAEVTDRILTNAFIYAEKSTENKEKVALEIHNEA